MYRRSMSYFIVRVSSDTVAENYGQVWLQFAMTVSVFGPEAATLDSWPAPQDQSSVEIVLTSWILVIIYQQAFIVQAD